jgi:hypothetical protein
VTAAGSRSYPELLGYDRRFPIGYLAQDQRHKARAWVSYDQPTPIGTFNFSLLQRYDSGTPYSALVTNLRVLNHPTACPTCPVNPGYLNPVSTGTYYFSDRGEFRTDDTHNTDLAINYNLPIGRINLFAQGELMNAFNGDTLQVPITTVSVVRAVNPFTGSYVECPRGTAAATCRDMFPVGSDTAPVGIWQKGADFGIKGVTPTTGGSQLPGGALGSYQLPRTYRFSLGLRF